jgi:hypothetical protein
MSAFAHQFRVAGKRLRATLFMRNRQLRVGTHWAWYWRWLFNLALMLAAGLFVWWLISNQHKVTGFNPGELRERVEKLTEDNQRLQSQLSASSRKTIDAEQQTAVEKATLSELSKTIAQLQEENAALKEDISFMRKMVTGSSAEAVSINHLHIERAEVPNLYRYRLVVIQGGDRKQDFKGKLALSAKIQRNGALSTWAVPDDPSVKTDLEFKFYQRLEGRFAVPEGSQVKALEVKVLAGPGGQTRASKSVSIG